MRSRYAQAAACLLVAALCALRFWHLTADFPNLTPWFSDQAKYTDEGWWASAAVTHQLTGRWILVGDYNPVLAVPVWPLVLGMLFHWTGVSIVAARALSVVFSLGTIVVVAQLVRRYTDARSNLPTIFAALLLACSPFAYVFSRMAILESLTVFEFCLLLLLVSFVERGRLLPWLGLTVVTVAMVLTKTTTVLLLPGVFWLAWMRPGAGVQRLVQSTVSLGILPAVLVWLYRLAVHRAGYGADYDYFFSVNGMPEIAWNQSYLYLRDLFLTNCLWVDRFLYPLAMLALVAAVVGHRALWKNPLFTASWIAFASQCGFILLRQDDYAPRYFLPMLVPVVLIVVIAADALLASYPKTAPAVVLTMAAVAIANLATISGYARHPTYDFQNAAMSMSKAIRASGDASPLLLGVSGSQMSLMTGIPSINDVYGTQELPAKIGRYKPGWYVAWNGVLDEDADALAAFRLRQVAAYKVFDNTDRDRLILYRMVPAGLGGEKDESHAVSRR